MSNYLLALMIAIGIATFANLRFNHVLGNSNTKNVWVITIIVFAISYIVILSLLGIIIPHITLIP